MRFLEIDTSVFETKREYATRTALERAFDGITVNLKDLSRTLSMNLAAFIVSGQFLEGFTGTMFLHFLIEGLGAFEEVAMFHGLRVFHFNDVWITPFSVIELRGWQSFF